MEEEDDRISEEFKLAFCKEYLRRAKLPVVASASDCTGTKYGGAPSYSEGDTWPLCGSCKKRLSFLFQVDLSDLDKARSGLIQVFHCLDESCQLRMEGEYGLLDSKGTTVRVHGKKASKLYPVSSRPPLLPEKQVTAWKEVDDFLDIDEFAEIYATMSDSEPIQLTAKIGKREFVVSYDSAENWFYDMQRIKDKANGWPAWTQGPEYPRCPKCDKPMRFIYQVLDDLHVSLENGTGRGYLFYCEEHLVGDFMMQQ